MSTSKLLGGPGDDRLQGGNRSSDALYGGPGRDIADGRDSSTDTDGVDTCRAEVRRRCER